jgi:GT2 family glycosyltransferase
MTTSDGQPSETSDNEPAGFVPLPASLQALGEHAGPAQVVMIDANQAPARLELDGRYREAWVVVCKRGVPCGMDIVDLSSDDVTVQERYQGLLTHYASWQPQFPDPAALVGVSLPRISVVIPSIVERIDELDRCLGSIGGVDYPDFEVVLVDNRRDLPDEDPLPTLVTDRPWLRVVRQSIPGISAARNMGTDEADGDVIAFTDDDVRVDPQWLRAIGTRFALNPQLDAVTGLILPAELETPAQVWFERYYGGFNGERAFRPLTLAADRNSPRMLRGSEIVARDVAGSEVRHFAVYGVGAYSAGANMAFRRSALARIGGFDLALGTGTRARGGEDLAAMIAVLWSGGQVGYEPSAVVHHRHRREYAELLRQMDGNGVGFTAMLTSLVWNDPRHLLGLSSKLPRVLTQLARRGAEQLRNLQAHHSTYRPTEPEQTSPSYPPTLAKHEYRAYLKGPSAYARSRAAIRSITTTAQDSRS